MSEPTTSTEVITYNDSKNVAVAKPVSKGCVYVAPVGTTLPTDAYSPLDPAFKCVGYLSEDGIKNTITRTSEPKNAFGGVTVANSQTEYQESTTYTMIETNETSMKIVYGDDHVELDATSGLHILHSAEELPEKSYVFETLLGTSRIKRTAVERASVSEVGEIAEDGTNLMGYPITLSRLPGTDGMYAHDYIAWLDNADSDEGAETDPQSETEPEIASQSLENESQPEKSIEDMTAPELKVYAATHEIPLGDAKTKAEILAVISEHNDQVVSE